MRRLLFALASLGILMAPTASAVATFNVEKITLLDDEDLALAIVPLGGVITIRAVLNNTGVVKVNETVSAYFLIQNVDKTYVKNESVSRSVDVNPGNTTTFEFTWLPAGRLRGNYTVTVEVNDGVGDALTKEFRVASTGVAEGDQVDRFLDYYWLFGGFLFCVILFAAVLGARRK